MWMWGLNFTLRPLTSLSHWLGDWVSLRAGLELFWEERNSFCPNCAVCVINNVWMRWRFNFCYLLPCKNWDSSIGIVARLSAGWSGARFLVEERDVPSPVRPDLFYCLPSPLFRGNRNSFTGVKVCVPTCLNGIDREQNLPCENIQCKVH